MPAPDQAQLNSKYDNLYNAQANPINQKRDSQIQNYQNQINQTNDNYNSLVADTKNKYQGLYTGLDQQQTQAGTDKYNQSNDVDTQVNQNLNRVMDIMAKNGWLGGGENLQAQLNSNSDRQNGFGKVLNAYNNIIQGINTNRNQFRNEETSLYNKYNADKTTNINNLNGQIMSARNNAASDLAALRATLEAQKSDELSKLQQAWEQQQQAAAQAAAKQAAQRQAAARQASTRQASAPKQAAAPKETVFQGAIGSLQNAMNDGNGGAWVQGNWDNINNYLTPQEKQAIIPGGYIYKQLRDDASGGTRGRYQ